MSHKFSALLFLLVSCLFAVVSCSPAELPPLEGTPVELADEFIGCLIKGDYEEGTNYFDGTMKRALPARKLKQLWEDLEEQNGPYESQSAIREDVVDGYDAVFITAKFRDDSFVILVVFDENRRVAGLWFNPA